MWKISHMISGDYAISNLEDNFSDLCQAALESIEGFEKKTGRKFDDYFTDKLFDGYTKTCLWTLKARKGARITKKFPLTNKMIPLENEDGEIIDIEDNASFNPSCIVSSMDYIQQFDEDKDLSSIVDTILKDPTVLNGDGKLNLQALSKKMGKSAYLLGKKITKLSTMLNKEM
jgi:hypothetical protein